MKRESFGIICCKFSTQGPLVLLIRKRYTYAYNQFVMGNYDSCSSAELIQLFNEMTVDEKLDILSLNFPQIWYRVWLNKMIQRIYCVSKRKYENAFLVDGGRRLQRLINASQSARLMWEIPKGRKKKGESPLQCAAREFKEETGLSDDKYRIVPAATRTMSRTVKGTIYLNKYFAALAKPDCSVSVRFDPPDQTFELDDVQWFGLADIRDSAVKATVRPIMNYIKKHFLR